MAACRLNVRMVKSDTSMAIVDQSVVSGSRFLTTICIGRLCGSEQLGVYALLFTLYLIFSCVQDAMMSTPYTVFGNRMKGAKRTPSPAASSSMG